MAAIDTFASTLRCPQTQQPLRLIDSARLDELNEAIRSGEVQNEAGDAVEQTLDGGLIREDETVLYPIRNGVPNLLLPDRIVLSDE